MAVEKETIMLVHIVQTNPTIGSFDSILSTIERVVREKGDSADLIVFPELSLCGYYPEDFLESPKFLAAHDEALSRATKLTSECRAALVVGGVERNEGSGKPLHNALFLLKGGRKILSYHKRLLPTYNIFDERRHFEPGTRTATWDFDGERVGFIICEDGWNDDGADYDENPVREAVAAGSTMLVSINASPSHVGKPQAREKMFSEMARKYGVPLIYANQVGAQDATCFDGHSFAVDAEGVVALRLRGFEEDEGTASVSCGSVRVESADGVRPLPANNEDFFMRQIVMGMRDYARRCGFSKVVVGSSGGIDSALVLALATEAFGARNVASVGMPSGWSSDGSVKDARSLAENLGVEFIVDPIKAEFDAFVSSFERMEKGPLTGLARQNVQARIRGVKLMEFSNQFGHLLLTTGNKSETSVGYCTLYGDTNGGLNPIGDLYKTEVQSLCRWINDRSGKALIPEEILSKDPSAELEPGQKDEDSLPAYPVLDAILREFIEPEGHLAEHMSEDELDRNRRLASGASKETREWVEKAVARAEYKRRQAPPILRVHARAFGAGRRMPIAHGFRG